MLAGLRKGRCDGDSSPLLNMMRNTCGVMTMLLMLVTKTHAFQTAPKPALPTSASRSQFRGDANGSSVRQRSSELNMMNWEDVMFNAQTTASSMASVSLDDPSNLISSVPIMYGAGLLTAFSPCVWGLLPLTISYISTAAGEREDKKNRLADIVVCIWASFCILQSRTYCGVRRRSGLRE
mmetsp:Transcript_12872/g.26329  ORF Transcript_12872/g.26329 Transcript_12872/m.26329 type:complete len:180 (+) Transcript_12872:289-828(+)